ncbi:MAG: hypothetical protein N2C14_32950 [Planctomycetales bacterium]
MKRLTPPAITSLLLTLMMIGVAQAEDVETRFLIPGKPIFEADFDDGKNPQKPFWQLRKSAWVVKDGVLRGSNLDGNGPFIRLRGKETGGPLPENYVMKFSFKTEPDPQTTSKKKTHETLSMGNRFSFGHYAAKYQWRIDVGMDLAIGHGHAIQDERYRVTKGVWRRVTAEIRGDEILVWFKDGPAYYMRHDHFRSKPAGWEFFPHVTEVGYLDDLKVWDLAEGARPGWDETLKKIIAENRAFLSSERPDFKIAKDK